MTELNSANGSILSSCAVDGGGLVGTWRQANATRMNKLFDKREIAVLILSAPVLVRHSPRQSLLELLVALGGHGVDFVRARQE